MPYTQTLTYAHHHPLQAQLSDMLSQHADMKHVAQKAFVSYLRSVHLQVWGGWG